MGKVEGAGNKVRGDHGWDCSLCLKGFQAVVTEQVTGREAGTAVLV